MNSSSVLFYMLLFKVRQNKFEYKVLNFILIKPLVMTHDNVPVSDMEMSSTSDISICYVHKVHKTVKRADLTPCKSSRFVTNALKVLLVYWNVKLYFQIQNESKNIYIDSNAFFFFSRFVFTIQALSWDNLEIHQNLLTSIISFCCIFYHPFV